MMLLILSALKPHIVEVLEKHRDEELTERREKRKKTQEEEAAKKAEEEKNKTTANKDQEQMEVGKFWSLFMRKHGITQTHLCNIQQFFTAVKR